MLLHAQLRHDQHAGEYGQRIYTDVDRVLLFFSAVLERAMAWSLSRRATSRSTLLELPAEIRSTIWTFALRSEKPLVTFHIDDYQKESYQEASQPALLSVSRQVRGEAIPIFYGCNDFIFHTEERQANDAHKWLYKSQPYLDILGGASFWLRYNTRVHAHITPSGAISVTMRYAARQDRWEVLPEWKWVTANRKPSDLEPDGEYLVAKLQSLIRSEQRQLNAEFFANLLSILRKSYIDFKIS